MNQPPLHEPSSPSSVTELEALADAFAGVLHTMPTSYSTPDRSQERLAEALTAVVSLAVRLDSQLNRTLTALGATGPADPAGYAIIASDLTLVIGNLGRALNEMAAAQDAHLFIDHFAADYDRPDVNTPFARGRTATYLGTARDALTEAAARLRYTAKRRATEERLRAAQSRGPRRAAPAACAVPVVPAPPPTTPATDAKSRS
ncbi:hypothetical protein VSR01_22445 [Actinacidiphila sp. DG2A-62]|uniref:hypothetical protein n=1 Tax=Actinacidiphila sp. DG2A-62 TaxID=3108821 RepID=UPI002DBD0C0B|nr:hypothetical protein [Actinacidiphila sp. DG2A-62]MEC3996125.1 hypothetical protein [Actinacidiphila sp. DG2A-62]